MVAPGWLRATKSNTYEVDDSAAGLFYSLRGAMYWIKFYIEILDDPKMATLEDRVWRRIGELFLVAGRMEADGQIPDTKQIAWMLRIPPKKQDQLADDLKRIESMGIITANEGGWFINNFKRRQAAITSTERSTQSRKKAKHEQYENANATGLQRNVAQNRTEQNRDRIETEAEAEQTKNPAPSSRPMNYPPADDMFIAERIYCQATSMPAMPGDSDFAYHRKLMAWARTYPEGRMSKIESTHIHSLAKHLEPYFVKWTGTKGQNGRPYSRTNLAWIDKAVSGEDVSVEWGSARAAEEMTEEQSLKIIEDAIHGRR